MPTILDSSKKKGFLELIIGLFQQNGVDVEDFWAGYGVQFFGDDNSSINLCGRMTHYDWEKNLISAYGLTSADYKDKKIVAFFSGLNPNPGYSGYYSGNFTIDLIVDTDLKMDDLSIKYAIRQEGLCVSGKDAEFNGIIGYAFYWQHDENKEEDFEQIVFDTNRKVIGYESGKEFDNKNSRFKEIVERGSITESDIAQIDYLICDDFSDLILSKPGMSQRYRQDILAIHCTSCDTSQVYDLTTIKPSCPNCNNPYDTAALQKAQIQVVDA
jgi:hypothetical protein